MAALIFRVGSECRAETSDAERITTDLTLQQVIQRVLEFNESIQVRMLEVEIGRRRYKAEKGIFEPEAVGSFDHQYNKRETTSQELVNSGLYRLRQFEEENNLYNAGLESLLPLGTRVRLGYTLRDLSNSYQPFTSFTNGEFVSFMGANLVQPLLKNGWMPATMAGIRLAAINSEVAFQDYRRQLMLTISTAEASYWNLYLAQEQLLFFRQSIELAETVLKDSQARLEAGKGTELDVLEAQSGLALRRSKQVEARQKYYDAVNRLAALYSDSIVSTNKTVLAVDEPAVTAESFSFYDSWLTAFEWNPDYLMQRKKIVAENIRLAYAKNQRLPQLDLRASYGLNGLGETPGDSWDHLEKAGFPSWSIGVEMRVPVGGGIKGRNELDIARLRQKQALISLKEIEVQIARALDTSIEKARSGRTDVGNYQAFVDYNQSLLQTRLAQLAVGKVETRKVLEADADLFEAKNGLTESKLRYRRALIELELVQGSLLNSRHIELNQKELEKRTARLARRGEVTDDQYDRVIRDVQLAYEQKRPPMNQATEEKSRLLLRETTEKLEKDKLSGQSPHSDEKSRILQILHEELDKVTNKSLPK